jgi:hypothetical protein
MLAQGDGDVNRRVIAPDQPQPRLYGDRGIEPSNPMYTYSITLNI